MLNIHKDPLIIKVEGTGGRGGTSIGEIIARAAARSGYYMQASRAFPAEIKGGIAWYQIKLSSSPVSWWGGDPDIYITDTKQGDWTIVYTNHESTEETQASFSSLKTAAKIGDKRSANVAAIGFLSATLGIDKSLAIDLTLSRFRRSAEASKLLSQIIDAGYDSAKESDNWLAWKVDKPDHDGNRLVINGNEAIALGALAAGVDFFCGYPITPASHILEFMMRELPKLGGVAMQMEDEMASLAACIGASYAGSRVLSATSGPGFALMSELLNLSVVAEIPVTIVDVQRSGPATGQPSRSEQADLLYALHGSPGDSPRIVLAPSTVEEAIYMSAQAVNMAQQLQMPVILLSDGQLANRVEAVPEPDWESIPQVERTRPIQALSEEFIRYTMNPSGISEMPKPGEDEVYVAAGMEHTEIGKPSADSELHDQMSNKRLRKLNTAVKLLESEEKFSTPHVKSGDIGLIGWGSTKGAIIEAVKRLRAGGTDIQSCHVRYMNPMNEDDLSEWMNSFRNVFVLEENRTGQLLKYIRHLYKGEAQSILIGEEQVITPELIVCELSKFDMKTNTGHTKFESSDKVASAV